MAYSAQIIADYILATTNNPVTPMQMIKLTYIAHGYTLAITKKPLIKARIEAWKYGPVIPVLYHAYKGYGSGAINNLNYCGTSNTDAKIQEREDFFKTTIDSETKNVLDQVTTIYSHLSALELSSLTHEKGTPWDKCYKSDRLFTLIPNHIIQEHYEKKMNGV